MKALMPVVLASVLSGFLGAVLALALGSESGSEEFGLDLGVGERLDALRSRLELVEKETEAARRERAEERARAGAGPAGASAAELAALRADLDRLRAGLETDDPAPAVVALESPGAPKDELAALIDQRLRIVQEEQRKIARERQEKQAAKKIDSEVRRRVQEFSKRLQLAPDQAERLESSYQEAVEVSMPLYGTLKDAQAGNDDRLAAIDRLRSNRREFDEAARSIMSAPQYEGFLQLRAKETEGISRWLDETEARIRGTTPPAR